MSLSPMESVWTVVGAANAPITISNPAAVTSSDSLEAVVEAAGPGGVVATVTSEAGLDTLLSTLGSSTPSPTSPVTLTLKLSENITGLLVDDVVPAGVNLVIDGQGIVRVLSSSPALTHSAGTVTYTNLTYVDSTNESPTPDPVVLITGGTAIFNNVTITEADAQTSPLVTITGGAFDISAGNNVFNASVSGTKYISNTGGSLVLPAGPSLGNTLNATTNEDTQFFIDVRLDGTNVASITAGAGANGTVILQPSGPNAGLLRYTPTANFYGTGTFSFSLASGRTGTITMTVRPVNDQPTFTISSPTNTATEDSGLVTVPGFASSIVLGPSNETSGVAQGPFGNPHNNQTATFSVLTNSNPTLFSVAPAISANGTLTYTPAANANGTAVIEVSLNDNGGTANGGVDTSITRTFTVSVTAVNDAPSFTIAGSPITVNEDSGAFTGTGATSITDGDPEVTQALSFTVTNDNNGLFAVQPSIDSTGQLIFTPAANANGTAVLTVTLTDDATAGGAAITTSAQTLTISVTAVNDAPSFTIAGSPITVNEDSGAFTGTGATSITDGDPEVTQAFELHGNERQQWVVRGSTID